MFGAESAPPSPGRGSARSKPWTTLKNLKMFRGLSSSDRAAQSESSQSTASPPHEGFCVSVSGAARVLTPQGYCPVGDLVSRNKFEVWTGCQWASAQALLARNYHTKYVVETSNGLSLACSRSQTWAVLAKDDGRPRIVAKTTDHLQPGDRLFPYQPPNYHSINAAGADASNNAPTRAPTRAELEKAYAAGSAISANPDKMRFSGGLPAQVHTMSHGAIPAFINGWADTQDGHLIGSPAVIQDLHLLLTRAGVSPCQTVSTGMNLAEIFIPSKFEIRFNLPDGRCFVPSVSPATVVCVEKKGSKVPCFHLVLDELVSHDRDNRPHTVLINSLLVLAPNAAALAPDSQSSDGSETHPSPDAIALTIPADHAEHVQHEHAQQEHERAQQELAQRVSIDSNCGAEYSWQVATSHTRTRTVVSTV